MVHIYQHVRKIRIIPTKQLHHKIIFIPRVQRSLIPRFQRNSPSRPLSIFPFLDSLLQFPREILFHLLVLVSCAIIIHTHRLTAVMFKISHKFIRRLLYPFRGQRVNRFQYTIILSLLLSHGNRYHITEIHPDL